MSLLHGGDVGSILEDIVDSDESRGGRSSSSGRGSRLLVSRVCDLHARAAVSACVLHHGDNCFFVKGDRNLPGQSDCAG